MQFIYITPKDLNYQKARAIRKKCFFDGMPNADELLDDFYEHVAWHLVYLNKEEEVVGTGRLHLEDGKAIISQMAIHPDFQNHGIGGKILDQLIIKSEKLNVDQILLSARITAQAFYLKKGFHEIGEIYASKKTGIKHINMILNF